MRDVGAVATGADGSRLQEWNVDLVFGIPGQSWEDAAADIDLAVAARPTHISLYDLTYTPAFAAWVARSAWAPAPRGRPAPSPRSISPRPRPGSNLPGTGATRSPTSPCPATSAGTTRRTGGARTTSASERPRSRRSKGSGAPIPHSVAAYLAGEPPLVEPISERTRLWEKAMLGLRTARGRRRVRGPSRPRSGGSGAASVPGLPAEGLW